MFVILFSEDYEVGDANLFPINEIHSNGRSDINGVSAGESLVVVAWREQRVEDLREGRVGMPSVVYSSPNGWILVLLWMVANGLLMYFKVVWHNCG